MFIALWAFEVYPEHLEAFQALYGSTGAWTQLFEKAPGYNNTQLLQDTQHANRFITLDYWESQWAYTAFQENLDFKAAYQALDAQGDGLTVQETYLGFIETPLDTIVTS